jgi:PAS domain S-box-containing protein
MMQREAVAATAQNALRLARRRLIIERLPLFAAGWLATTAVWAVVLLAEGRITLRFALLLPAVHALVLAITLVVVRVDLAAARVQATVGVATALLSISMTGLIAATGGDGDLLAFVLLALYVSSTLCFVWERRTALAVLVAIVLPWVLGTPWLRFFVPTSEIVASTVFGTMVCVAVAEVALRGFVAAFERDERQRQATRVLAESLDAYRDLAENARDLIYTHDLEGRLTYVNAALARYLDSSPAALVGRNCQELIAVRHPESPDVPTIIARIAAGESVPPVAFPVERPDGLRWVECAASAMHDATGAVVGVRGIARDVTVRRDAEERLRALIAELQHSEEMLRLLGRRQVRMREEERKRIGFGLQDDVCQEIVGVGILLESLRRRLPDTTVPEAEGLAQIGRRLNEILSYLRGIAHDLRPLLLRDLGLEGSVRSLADGASSPATRVIVSFPAPVPRLEEEVEIVVYRIAQEALANAARHARAHTIHVTLAVLEATLELQIRDDGCGFSVGAERVTPHLGLVGMRECALALGGRLDVTSEPGRGTLVHLTCPSTPAAHAIAT